MAAKRGKNRQKDAKNACFLGVFFVFCTVTLLSAKKHLTLISGFLTGCITGAVMAKYIGLSAVAVPSFMLTVFIIDAGLWPQGKKQLP